MIRVYGKINKNGKASMLGRKHSEETKLKMREKALADTTRGKRLLGKKLPAWWVEKAKNNHKYHKFSSIEIERMRQIGLLGVMKQQQKKETVIEKIVYNYLHDKNVQFYKQHLVNGKFLVDAYIPKSNTIIECDGKYWHSLSRVVKKDYAENAYLKQCGYNLIRLPEQDILNGSFLERMVV
jgi:very-short-patch-repair endonuclease